jgi:hypothetical protein
MREFYSDIGNIAPIYQKRLLYAALYAALYGWTSV